MNKTEVKVVGLSFRHVTEKLEVGDRVKLVPEPDNKYDPNALSVQTLNGEKLGYVGKKDPLRLRMLEQANKEEVTLPVLVVNYHKEGEDKLWDSVEGGDMVQLWLRALSKTPIEDTTFTEIESFTGEPVLWSEYLHVCTDMQGNELMGGSTYAAQFDKEFNQDSTARAYAKKNDLDPEVVKSYWESLGKTSMNYGTAIHTALEHYCKHFKVFGHEKSLPRQTPLREAVKAFLRKSDFDNCIAEPLITDTEKGMSGWIDCLRFHGDKEVTIEDYKTNTFNRPEDYIAKWPLKLKTYKRQLRFYGTILHNHGYKVNGLTVWHYHEGEWKRHSFAFKPIKEYEREVVQTR